jgi:hypothetical protein
MRKIATYSVMVLLCAALITGCAAGMSPVTGFLFSDVKGPAGATSNAGSAKTGTTECTSILGLVGTGDCSIETAAKHGKITKIHHVDYHTTSILGIYAKVEVTVYGE